MLVKLRSLKVTYLSLSKAEELRVTWESNSYSERFEHEPRGVYSEVLKLDELITEAINTAAKLIDKARSDIGIPITE